MGFHDEATSEVSALIDRLHASRTERSLRQIQIFREALDAATRSVETTIAALPESGQDDQLKNLVERLAATADAHAQALVDRANASAKTAIESVQATLDERIDETEDLRQSLRDARTQLDALRAEIESEVIRARDAEARYAKAEHARTHAEAAWVETENALQHETESRAAFERELQEVRKALDVARLEAEASTKLLEREAAERAKLIASLAKQPPQPFDALLTAFQRLTTATTIDEVLGTLVDALASDFSRVALFRVNGNQLEVVRQIGLEFDDDMSKAVMPLNVGSHLTHAVASGCVEGCLAAELPEGRRLPFSGAPDFVLTVPIVVRREALAVIYADDVGRPQNEPLAPEPSIKFAQILLSHATPLLTNLSTNLVALAELRQYATMLVNEIEHIYHADASAGKHAEELQSRMRENLQCARQIYAQRATPEGLFAASLLEEQLALQAQSGTPFGRDIAALLERPQSPRALEAVS
jgi:hypothetical protein